MIKFIEAINTITNKKIKREDSRPLFSVRQAVVLIVDNQLPIINCFILETIKYKILVTLYKSH